MNEDARTPESNAGTPSARDVTVAVLCRADEPALAQTLCSLEAAAQRLAADGRTVRFTVCVNGPGDGPALGAARAFASRYPADRALVLVEARPDKARAWNLARAACTTPLLVFCDADVVVAPDALLRLASALDEDPRVSLVSARQVPVLDPPAPGTSAVLTTPRRTTLVARAAAIPYRFDFQVVGGRLYMMRAAILERMPEALLLEDGWISARLGNEALRTVRDAEVYFLPPSTLADCFRERLRTEAGKLQIREERRDEGRAQQPIARYRWGAMLSALGPADLPLVILNLAVRISARGVAVLAARRGKRITWLPIVSSKPRPTEVP